jgi:Amt family ammonium transporter
VLGLFTYQLGFMDTAATIPTGAMAERWRFIAAASGLTAATLWVWRRFGAPDPSMTANGMLAGLVAITASCAFVSPWAALVIGATAGIIVVEAVWFIERWLLVDDPVGAVAVHFVCGMYGVFAVGIFAKGTYGDGLNGVQGGVTGLLYGDPGQFIAQLFACFAVCVFGGGMAYAFFRIQDRLVGIRSLPEHEAVGLDLPEIGAHAYPELQIDPMGSSSQHHPLPAAEHHSAGT